jgi:adenylosuccinate lyase
MKLAPLTAISPVDGRYRSKTESLDQYFSEYALIRYRIFVEVEYFLALSEIIPPLNAVHSGQAEDLRSIYLNYSEADTLRIKELEAVTNHDVKAVEYYLREKFLQLGLAQYMEFIHFGLTSQDINNTAIPLSLKDAQQHILIPMLARVIDRLKKFALEWKEIPMLARTHGQPASPTFLGKEFYVFVDRLIAQKDQLVIISPTAKFGGATGNMNAHYVAYPNIEWQKFANYFIGKKLEMKRSQYTTQIDHYDNLAASFDAFARINTILIDLCRDVWMYISLGYFKQKIKETEVGSSAMPHKVNPIDFENAEGNLGIANALLHHFSSKLPISRLQRDLTDSTVLRNIGVPLAHSFIAWQGIFSGLEKLILNEPALQKDLNENWAVIAEAVQTILRRENYPDPYGALKSFTRKNEVITSQDFKSFVDSLNVSEEVKNELHAITPFNYTGKFIL